MGQEQMFKEGSQRRPLEEMRLKLRGSFPYHDRRSQEQ